MALLIAAPHRETDELARLMVARMPNIDLRTWPEISRAEDIRFVLAWQAPRGLFAKLPGLQAVSSLGAGVDSIISDPEIPSHLAIGRLAGPRLAANMAAYLASMVIARWKDLPGFMRDQQRGRWNQWAPEHPPAIGLLGTGQMGQKAAEVFQSLEFPVHGYSHSGRGPDGVTMHHGDTGLARIAAASDFLINLLPLTAQTRDILNQDLFANMRRGSVLINVGRGEQLIDADLVKALAKGRPACAVLDVFRQEPLPPEHPFWAHPAISITPHCASITLTAEAAELAVESYRRVLAGLDPLGRVDRSRGY
ncbi:MAG: glyoxylate/hydroxypyruvate reductase A [Wenzhouxiangellaceae bacterium]|nr:glyoxylate/hydroxypyruvate reductase A [Wenzhouxiangellaceae bacterium]